jgi:adenylate cyclase
LAGKEFRPSERLIRQSLESGQSVAYVWSSPGSGVRGPADFTLSEGIDWAVCTPVPGKSCAGWGLYVTGGFSSDFAIADREAESLRDDVKFAELVATTLGGLRESHFLAAREASLSQFFSPIVLSAIRDQDPDTALAPRASDVTVLFCDLRGFTRESERSSADLFGLLDRVSQALGVMTERILASEGVVGDFHGDAAMGFWGWPIAQADSVERACRAALEIESRFAGDTACHADSPLTALADFRVGIGIATGRAVAGKIGTQHQVKVTAFGPVVNLASRLETLTRQTGSAILVDAATALTVRGTLPRNVCRVRRLARVLPVGFSAPVEVSELLPSAKQCPQLPDEQLAAYEAALDTFMAGNWQQARDMLLAIPRSDHAREFLLRFIDARRGLTDQQWDGTILLDAK